MAQGLKLYLRFAALHMCYKILKALWLNLRAYSAWKHIPGTTFDIFCTRLKKNFLRVRDYYLDQYSRFPSAPLLRKTEGCQLSLICNNAESVQWLLKDDFQSFTKPASETNVVYKLLREFIGPKGIFTLSHGKHLSKESHEMWFKQRKIASKIFTRGNFSSFMSETFIEKAIIMTNVILKEDEYFDMQNLCFRFSMDSIEKLFFGKDVNSLQGEMSIYAKAFDGAGQCLLKLYIQNLVPMIMEQFLPFPFDRCLWDLSRKNTTAQKKFETNVKILYKHVQSFIEEIKVDKTISERRDLLANFLNSELNLQERQMEDDMLRDLILNATIAGRDTTACAMSWMLYELSENLHVQKLLCAEISRCSNSWKEKDGFRVPKLEDITHEKMPILTAVIYETLRLHPPVPVNFKVATRDTHYLDGTLVPKGVKVVYDTYSINRNPANWSRPNEFLVDRWIPFKQPSMYKFPVFQAGPRFCLGKDMALLEMKILACVLLQKVEIKLKKGEKIYPSMSLNMSISNNYERTSFNLWMKASQREN
eukprot:augustus_masked-scaffold_10-processed-gene-10.47-mRNA-1 protein AED:0.38 eAED:0.38 QI:0/-1/0/1/-1/1/1/0/533